MTVLEGVVVDVDGVLADTAGYSYGLFIGAPLNQVSRYENFFGVAAAYNAEGYTKMLRAWSTAAFWAELPTCAPVQELRRGMDVLRRRGEVTLATVPYVPASDLEFRTTWIETRRAWLAGHALGEAQLVFGEQKADLPGKVLIEDRAETGAAWLRAGRGRKVILVDHPWNRHAPYPHHRARTFLEACYLAYACLLRGDDGRLANLQRVRPPRAGSSSDVCRVDRRGGSLLGNPFVEGSDGDRIEVIAKYAHRFDAQVEASATFRAAVEEARGRRLGCWCAPLPCHASVILDYHDRTPPPPSPPVVSR